MIASSLALSLDKKMSVQFLDCDVEEPNAHIILNPVIEKVEPVCIQVPEVNEAKCTFCGKCSEICAFNAIAVLSKHILVFPNLCHGCGACSFLCPEKAISEQGREIGTLESGHSNRMTFLQGKLAAGEAMPTPVIRKVKDRINYNETVIIDVPPGTSCPVVQSIKESDFCLLVTDPTPFGLNDLMLAVETTRQLNIPCGVVINRDGENDGKVHEYCLRENIPVLLTIPLDMNIARLYSRGIALVEGIPRWKPSFTALYNSIKELTSERDNSLKR